MNDKSPKAQTELVTLILRDANRTDLLRMQIRRSGGRAISLPAFHFETVCDCKPAINFLRAPQNVHWLFFAGPHGISSLRQLAVHHRLPLPHGIACAALGQASRKTLLAAGFTNIVALPGINDLEGLLNSKQLGRLNGKRVALVQRLDSPPRAAQELGKFKCIVTPLQCYRRLKNSADTWIRLDEKLRREINSILAFDAASLHVLLELTGEDAQRIRKLPLGVIHRNIQEKAAMMGYENIIASERTTEMLDQLRHKIEQSD